MIAVLTSNQPRHLALLRRLGWLGATFAVIEPKSFAVPTSPVMARYWARVQVAEAKVFPDSAWWKPSGCSILTVPMGEASALPHSLLTPILWADRVIVFGSSYLKGPLAEHLVRRGALNLHVGIAPEYRGAAPNAWALYDGNDHLVGAQVQRLSLGLDAGEILAEARVLPDADPDPFVRGMLAAKFGIEALARLLMTPEREWKAVRPNDRSQQLRYSRAADFTEEVAAAILAKAGA